jgi:hypothetical protein
VTLLRMKSGMSMASRAGITKRCAKAFSAWTSGQARSLDEVVAVAGQTRDDAGVC